MNGLLKGIDKKPTLESPTQWDAINRVPTPYWATNVPSLLLLQQHLSLVLAHRLHFGPDEPFDLR